MLKFPSFVQDPIVLGINDKRQIVGEYFDDNGNFHGFLMRRPAYIPNSLPNPGNMTRESVLDDYPEDDITAGVLINRPWFLAIPGL
jgi:hypothetical protein